MKICLVNPPFIAHYNRQVRWSAKTSGGLHPPVYLAYAASNLKKHGHEVKLIDAVAEEMGRDAFVDAVKGFGPDILIMEVGTPSIINDSELASIIKKEVKGVKIAFTGAHVSALPEETMSGSEADFVLKGEYDETVVELADALKNKKPLEEVDGIFYRKGKEVKSTKPRKHIEKLDSLPWPMYEQLPVRKYKDTLLYDPFVFVVSGRGCLAHCTFCQWPQLMYGHKDRRRDPKDVVDEVEHWVKKYRLKSFKFFDDTFTFNKDYVKEVCRELIKRRINTPWICNARADGVLDEETLRLMKRAGCMLFKIGVESGNQEILDWVKKGTNVQGIKKFFRMTNKVGIKTFASFMIGFPQETRETIDQTFQLAKDIKPTMVQFVIVQPLPGTELYRQMADKGVIPKNLDWSKYITKEGYVDLAFEHPTFSQEELRGIVSKMWSGYFLRPEYMIRRFMTGIKQPKEMAKNMSGMKKIFRYRKSC